MRIIFVGLHNKPGKEPLDSSTMTGKIVDEIIYHLDATCVKMNLYDTDRLPNGEEASYFKRLFVQRAAFGPDDIGVFFGQKVVEELLTLSSGSESPWKVACRHPGSLRYGGMSREAFIADVVERVKATENYKKFLHSSTISD